MQTCRCPKGCCKVTIATYHGSRFYNTGGLRRRRKAGIFIYDPKRESILLVQSRGNLWGLPKGSLNIDESDLDGAIREVKEETGLDINPELLTKYIRIKGNSVYYYLEKPVCEVNVQPSGENQDANGITWIKLDCLKELIENGNMSINTHCREVLYTFTNRVYPENRF